MPSALSVLRNGTYRRLFTAQVVALVGTGLATVALSLLAYDLAGDGAPAVLGTALAIKMIAYVTVAPLVTAVADRVPRRVLMAATDLTRAGAALALPLVTEVWQIHVLIFLLQAASAAFTPAFQATIPEVLPDEQDYTRALSMSRLAYDLESLFSPVLAAALLTVVSYDRLFAGTVVGFLASAALVTATALPRPAPVERTGGIYAKAAFGTRLFRATPRLRALLALDLAVAAGGAVVFVDTVAAVRGHLDRPAGAVSVALGAYGAGSVLTALALPRLLLRSTDRTVMLRAAASLPVVLTAVAVLTATAPGAWSWPALLGAWAAIGAASSAVLTPGGRVVRRSTADADLPAAFAARFSLSHGCWLLTYPLAGWLAPWAGLPLTVAALGAVALAATAAAAVTWPVRDPDRLDHVHPDLPPGHPHLADARPAGGGWLHGHHYVIDQHHHHWPGRDGTHRKTPGRSPQGSLRSPR
ncbi:MFS transporter [Streptomyces erythrochromogenes]|uniref:MFS transporter n=1 Tax=Streptomyces erythrochromogenes TaxID=285574 RepID=UPI002251E003|nr:MFS transporter [Streptomyces erythrochromogenes]MCX5588547.1 MFS transporter [Streptomyces erythrochromogenes]